MPEDRLEQLDYYTLLGLEQDASSDEIREAFHHFALKFHPDKHVGDDGQRVARAEEIYRRGAEAYRILLDADDRHRYNLGLARGQMRYEPTSEERFSSRRPSAGVLQVRSPRARPFAQRAESAIRAKDWKTARLNLQVALGHEPENEMLQARLAMVESELALQG